MQSVLLQFFQTQFYLKMKKKKKKRDSIGKRRGLLLKTNQGMVIPRFMHFPPFVEGEKKGGEGKGSEKGEKRRDKTGHYLGLFFIPKREGGGKAREHRYAVLDTGGNQDGKKRIYGGK